MKRFYLFYFMVCMLVSCGTSKKTVEKSLAELGPNPYIELDNKQTKMSELAKYEPEEIAVFSIYHDKDATKHYGAKAKDGAVVIMTKEYATNKYQSLFKSFSKEYEQVLNENERSEIQYILNKKPISNEKEFDLSLLTEKELQDIKVIGQKELLEKYQIEGKKVGVAVKAKKPNGLE